MSLSRRGLLTGLAAGTGVLCASNAEGGGSARFAGHPGRFGLLHDTTLCVGCRSCEFACALVNERPTPKAAVDDKAVFAATRRTSHDTYTVVNRYRTSQGEIYRKHQCMHCNEPCCATVCLVRAFEKTPEGPVLYHPELCMGCRYCVTACPYYALAYDYQDPLAPEVRRCTMCYPRIKQGKQPGCAQACPTGAIRFGRREELVELAHERIRGNPGRYVPQLLGEREFGGTSWLVLAGVDFAELGLAAVAQAPDTPLPELATSYLSVVPLVITLYPGLLMGLHAFAKRRDEVAKSEQQAAVAEALAHADEATQKKLAEATAKANKERDDAVAQAVKKALAAAAPSKEQSP
jgi:formate dehydrogenase iron-sulfur subunit